MEQQKEKEAFRKYQELKGLQQQLQEERWRLATPERQKRAKPKVKEVGIHLYSNTIGVREAI